MKAIDTAVIWWVSPKLPRIHLVIKKKSPKEYLWKYLVHPIKRRVARYYLFILRKLFGLKVIGITGSAGKTTTKEMVASILSQKGNTVSSLANIDPVYNIPSTILRARPSTKYLVLEMGVEFPGEMDFYLWLARPDIGVITNIYPTHTVYFKDIEGVAEEKGKLIRALSKNGYAILNVENEFSKKFSKKAKGKVLLFGTGSSITASSITYSALLNTKFTLTLPSGKLDVRLPILGAQFVENALAASSVGHVLGVSLEEIKKGLEGFRVPEHRMKVIRHSSGAVVVDDSYNNNPKAARKALQLFNEVAGGKGKIVVFGDMLELGEKEREYHREVAGLILEVSPSKVICVGPLSKIISEILSPKIGEENVFWFASYKGVYKALRPLLKSNSIILIKGSRSIGLDRVVSRLS
jgi:UDP-N-acetylmuramoyl-tripeptide--D-alanyl-D-alanine ligase